MAGVGSYMHIFILQIVRTNESRATEFGHHIHMSIYGIALAAILDFMSIPGTGTTFLTSAAVSYSRVFFQSVCQIVSVDK